MNFPSLLFKNDYPVNTTDSEATEDLRLSLLLCGDVLQVFSMPCEKDDIIMRQELFCELEDEKMYAHFTLLADNLRRISALCDRAKESGCVTENNGIYLSLIRALSDFYANASIRIGKGKLYERFYTFFEQKINDEETKTAFRVAVELYEEYTATLKTTWSCIGEELKIDSGVNENYTDKLLCAAQKMKLGKTSVQVSIARPLIPEIPEGISTIFSPIYAKIDEFCKRYGDIFDENILRYKTELEFYISVTDLNRTIQKAGIPLCRPQISDDKCIYIKNAYDITLLKKDCKEIIPNDVMLTKDEPFFFLTGANGGGKTTYLRALGISALLFSAGAEIPAESARMSVLSSVYTHFPKDERFESLGRFGDEKARIFEICESCDDNSLVLLNETFSTTGEKDAEEYTEELANTLHAKESFGIYVTHRENKNIANIPYLNVIVDENDENRRTYKISRRLKAEGSFAKDILKKYGLTSEQLEKRYSKLY